MFTRRGLIPTFLAAIFFLLPITSVWCPLTSTVSVSPSETPTTLPS
jgi:hypothetical protein